MENCGVTYSQSIENNLGKQLTVLTGGKENSKMTFFFSFQFTARVENRFPYIHTRIVSRPVSETSLILM